MNETTVTVTVYKSRKPLGRQKFRWRAVGGNGRNLANSGEAYTNASDIEDAVLALFGQDTATVRVEWPSGISAVLRGGV